ncbi:MAG: alpha/beta hydrolase [Xanthomonadales bacterium]|nr:alpha/beta hydrolase [Xanthomonadales bacterium]
MSNHSQNNIIRSSIAVAGHTLSADYPANLSARSGPVWMFIHGIAVTSAFWEPLMPAHLRDNSPWISVSLPVHAPSTGPTGFSREDISPDLFNTLYSEVLDQFLAGRDVVIVGHSTGGFAGLCLALARPDRVRGVVSVGGFADGQWIGLEGDMQLMARKEKLGSFGPIALRIAAWLTTRWPWLQARAASMFAYDKQAFLSDEPTKDALGVMRRDARLQNQDQLIAFFAGIRDVDIWDQISQINQPVLVLDGEHDPVIPYEKTLRLADTLPNGQLLLYPGVGHMVMNERREDFWRDILSWQTSLFTGEKL